MKTARDALDQLTRDVLAAYHATDPSGAFEAIKAVLARSLPTLPGLGFALRLAKPRLQEFAEMLDDMGTPNADVVRALVAVNAALAATPEATPPTCCTGLSPECVAAGKCLRPPADGMRYFTCTCAGPKHGKLTGCSGTGADFTGGLCGLCIAECRGSGEATPTGAPALRAFPRQHETREELFARHQRPVEKTCPECGDPLPVRRNLGYVAVDVDGRVETRPCSTCRPTTLPKGTP